MGDQGRRAGLGQRHGDGPAAGGRPEPQIHDPEHLSTMHLMAPLPDEQREAWNNLWQEVKAFYAA